MNVWRILSLVMCFVVGLALPATASAAPPAPPTAFTVAAPTQVHAHAGTLAGTLAALVTWQAPANTSGMSAYRIFTYQDTAQQPLGMTIVGPPTTFAVITHLAVGHSYTFRVQAVATFTALSALSNTVTLGTSALAAPAGLQGTVGSGAVSLSWAPVAGAQHYVILTYLAASSQPSLQALAGYLDGISGTSATVSGLTNGTRYLLEVRAVDAQQLLSPAAALTATPQAPAPPARAPDPVANVQAVVTNGQVTVSWLPAYNGGSPITSYTVATSTNLNNPADVKAIVHPATDGWMFSGGRWSAPVSGLTTGSTYVFYVFASNALGISSAAISNSLTFGTTVPAPPTNVQAQGGDRMAVVSWNHPSTDGGSPILRYVVTYSLNPNDVAAVVDLTTPQGRALWTPVGVSVPIPGLTNGRSYVFYVYAVNAVGVGGFSLPSAVTTLAVRAPDPVTGISAVAGNGQATVSWLPAYDGGSAVTSYIVTYAPNPNAVLAVVHPATDAWMFNGSRWNVTIGSLTNGQSYTFYVYATNAAGTSGSVASATVTLGTVPGTVQHLSATAGDGSVTVTWTVPATDGGVGITGYQVTASDGTHAPTVAHVTGTSVTLPGLTNGVAYSITVAALNGLGSGAQAATAATPRNLAPTLTAPVSLTVDHGDQVAATVSARGPELTDHLVLAASDLPAGVTFTDLGNGSGVLNGNAEVPAGTYPITFSVSDGHNPAVTTLTSLTVIREQAVVRFLPTAPLSVTLKGAASAAKSITIGATVREATDPNGNADIGEAADITYTLTAVDTGATYTGHAMTTGGGIEGVLTARNTFRTIPIGVYDLKVTVGGAYYQGSAEVMVAVSNPSIKGGLAAHGSVLVPGTTTTANFTISAKRKTNGALTGSVRYSEGTGYVLQSTKITAIVIKGNREYVQGVATLNGVGSHQFVATGVDNHQKGSADRFGLRVIDPSFVTVNHCTFAPVQLTSGQVRVTR